MNAETRSPITKSEQFIRDKFDEIYGNLARKFYDALGKLDLSESELAAVPSLFLPSCGSLYAQSLIKLAVIGESSFKWGHGLGEDLKNIKEGRLDLSFSFNVFRQKGPVFWQNPFWRYHAEVLQNIYSRRDALEKTNPIFAGIAYGNRYSIEQYRENGTGVDTENISRENYDKIAKLTRDIERLENFIDVFSPDIIIYTCRNDYGSDDIFPPEAKLLCTEHQPENWDVKIWKYKKTKIIQTQHPNYLTRGRITSETYGRRMSKKLFAINCLAPVCAQKHYTRLEDASHFVKILNKRASEFYSNIPAENIGDEFLRILSYKLILAIALELTREKATMTAVLACALLNQVEIFQQKDWQYSLERRGPCSTIRGAYNLFEKHGEKEHAATIAYAFTKMNGCLAW